MTHLEVIHFLLQVSVLLVGATVFAQLAKFLKLPTVIGELTGGIVLGPTLLGVFAPTAFAFLFPSSGAATVGRDALAGIGLLLFLFLAGSEIDLSHFRGRARCILWTSLCGMLVPFVLGVVLVRVYPGSWGPDITSTTLRFQFLIGTAMAISALPVIARILKDLNLLRSDLGFIVLAAAAVDDLVGWTLFGAVIAPPGGGSESLLGPVIKTLVVVGVVLLVGHFVCRPLLKRLAETKTDPSVSLAIVLIFILLASAATEAAGVHAVVGAFLMGIVLKVREGGDEGLSPVLTSPLLGLLAPLYFVSVGLKANFATHFDPLMTFAITLVACLGKTLGGGFGAWRGGLKGSQALAVGFGMNARGAMAIILATVALEHRLIDERIFVSLVFMALFTSLLSGPVMGFLLQQKPDNTIK